MVTTMGMSPSSSSPIPRVTAGDKGKPRVIGCRTEKREGTTAAAAAANGDIRRHVAAPAATTAAAFFGTAAGRPFTMHLTLNCNVENQQGSVITSVTLTDQDDFEMTSHFINIILYCTCIYGTSECYDFRKKGSSSTLDFCCQMMLYSYRSN